MVRCRQSLGPGRLLLVPSQPQPSAPNPHRSPPPPAILLADCRARVRAPALAKHPRKAWQLAAPRNFCGPPPAASAPHQLPRSSPVPLARRPALAERRPPGGGPPRRRLPPRPSAPPQPSVRRRFAAAWPSVLTPLPPAPLAARQQDAADKEDAGRQAQAEPPHPAVDPHAHGQPDPVQREAPALAPHEDRPLDYSLRERS